LFEKKEGGGREARGRRRVKLACTVRKDARRLKKSVRGKARGLKRDSSKNLGGNLAGGGPFSREQCHLSRSR